MVNNKNIINSIVEQIKSFSKDDFVNAMKSVDEMFNQTIEFTISYSISVNDYKVENDLNTFNIVHTKKRKLFGFLQKDVEENNESLEAA